VSDVAVEAVFLSNLPEGLSSVFEVYGGIALASGGWAAAAIGVLLLGEATHEYAGLVTAAGFLTVFALSKWS
jgi:hypothetical protein